MRDALFERLKQRWPNFDGQLIGIKYLRASQDASGRSISVGSQEDEGTEFFEENGIVDAGTFYDNNLSASTFATAARQDYERALEELRSGRVHLLWTFDSSRAQRDLEVYVKLRRICIETGTLWAYGGRIYDMSDPADRKATARDALEAEGASDTISTHVRRGVRKRARAGEHAGPLPYGYRREYDPETGDLLGQVINPDEKAVIREIVERVLAAEPLSTIAKDFNKRGITCPRDRQWHAGRIMPMIEDYRVPAEWERFLARLDEESAELATEIVERVKAGETPKEIGRELNRNGVPYILPTVWCGSKVRRAALSDVAAGIRIHQGKPVLVKMLDDNGDVTMKPVKAAWEPIITETEHKLLKARLGDPKRKTSRDGSRVKHLWVGIARCGECEGRIVPRRKPAGYRYQCINGCVIRPKEKFDAWLTEQALLMLEREDAADIFRIDAEQDKRSLAAAEEARNLRAELDGWRQDAIAGKVSRESFAAIEPGLLDRIRKADARAKRAALPPVLEKVIGPGAREAFDALTIAQKREILRTIMRPRVFKRKRKKSGDLETETITPGFLFTPGDSPADGSEAGLNVVGTHTAEVVAQARVEPRHHLAGSVTAADR